MTVTAGKENRKAGSRGTDVPAVREIVSSSESLQSAIKFVIGISGMILTPVIPYMAMRYPGSNNSRIRKNGRFTPG
jgi:hypothetical protein